MSAKKWVGGVRKWQFLLIYSTIYADVGRWVGLKKPKTCWRNTGMAPYDLEMHAYAPPPPGNSWSGGPEYNTAQSRPLEVLIQQQPQPTATTASNWITTTTLSTLGTIYAQDTSSSLSQPQQRCGANQIHVIKKFHLKKLLHFLLPTMVVGCVVISLIILPYSSMAG